MEELDLFTRLLDALRDQPALTLFLICAADDSREPGAVLLTVPSMWARRARCRRY